MRFDGSVKDEKLPPVFHETVKEDKGPQLSPGGFISPLPIDIEDVEVNPLYVIFNLKGVLVGKDYFKINHLLPSLFNLVRSCTLSGKSVVPKQGLKEFLLRCLE
jgi:hypothetical protein